MSVFSQAIRDIFAGEDYKAFHFINESEKKDLLDQVQQYETCIQDNMKIQNYPYQSLPFIELNAIRKCDSIHDLPSSLSELRKITNFRNALKNHGDIQETSEMTPLFKSATGETLTNYIDEHDLTFSDSFTSAAVAYGSYQGAAIGLACGIPIGEGGGLVPVLATLVGGFLGYAASYLSLSSETYLDSAYSPKEIEVIINESYTEELESLEASL